MLRNQDVIDNPATALFKKIESRRRFFAETSVYLLQIKRDKISKGDILSFFQDVIGVHLIPEQTTSTDITIIRDALAENVTDKLQQYKLFSDCFKSNYSTVGLLMLPILLEMSIKRSSMAKDVCDSSASSSIKKALAAFHDHEILISLHQDALALAPSEYKALRDAFKITYEYDHKKRPIGISPTLDWKKITDKVHQAKEEVRKKTNGTLFGQNAIDEWETLEASLVSKPDYLTQNRLDLLQKCIEDYYYYDNIIKRYEFLLTVHSVNQLLLDSCIDLINHFNKLFEVEKIAILPESLKKRFVRIQENIRDLSYFNNPKLQLEVDDIMGLIKSLHTSIDTDIENHLSEKEKTGRQLDDFFKRREDDLKKYKEKIEENRQLKKNDRDTTKVSEKINSATVNVSEEKKNVTSEKEKSGKIKLSKNDLDLIDRIFNNDNNIRYTDIVTLIANLGGTIIENGGAHKRVVLNNLFSEFYSDSIITGGISRPHKSCYMSRYNIKLIQNILLQASEAIKAAREQHVANKPSLSSMGSP